MNDLKPYVGETCVIAGQIHKLELQQDLAGEFAVWRSDRYLIYATPMWEGVAIPVQVMTVTGDEVGTEGYPAEIDTYERYCKCVKTLAEKIFRCARM